MGKKIVLAVFGGVALFGLALAIVGFALGGRLGGVGVADEKLVYYTGDDSIAFADAPAWMQNWRGRFYNIGIGGLSIAQADDARGSAAAPAALSLPSFAGDIEAVDIDISAGYLHIVSGEEYSLQVDGEMEYTSEFQNGTWQIRSHHSGIRLRGGGRRFWLNGKDVTTTFTLVLPPQCGALELSIGAGQASVTGLTLDALACEVSAGSLQVRDTDAASADLTVSAGGITAAGLRAGACTLDCDAGSIQMEGDITVSLHAVCGAGAIEVRIPAPADYGWESEVDLGKATVDGHGAAGIGGRSHGGNPDARPFFDLECGMGDVEVIFI